MYKDIEKIYKKESPYNKIKIKTFWVYILSIPFLLMFNYFKIYFMLFLTIVIVILIMKKISEKILNEKLYFNFSNEGKATKPLSRIIEEKEKILFINYLESKSLYNKEIVKCFLDHYRCYIKPKIVGDNFLSILSIIISVLLAFVSKSGFDIKSFEMSIPYLVCLILLFITVYFPISKIGEIKKFFSGEDGMIERLESLFSELYVEFDEKNNKKNITKTTKKASKNRKRSK